MNPIVLLVIALAAAVVVHEGAHALALRRLGFPIDEAGIGLPIPPQGRFHVPRIPFTVTVSPWLLGAYVKAHPDDQEEIDALPYRDKAWFMNAGIIANLLAGGAIAAVTAALHGRALVAVLLAAAVAGTWIGRRLLAAYVVPALALPLLIWLVGQVAGTSISAGNTGFGYASLANTAPQHTGPVEALAFIGAVNLALAALNALPLFGLDNGKVVGEVLRRWAGARSVRIYEAAGLSLVLLSLVAAIASDVWALAVAVIK